MCDSLHFLSVTNMTHSRSSLSRGTNHYTAYFVFESIVKSCDYRCHRVRICVQRAKRKRRGRNITGNPAKRRKQ